MPELVNSRNRARRACSRASASLAMVELRGTAVSVDMRFRSGVLERFGVDARSEALAASPSPPVSERRAKRGRRSLGPAAWRSLASQTVAGRASGACG